MKSFTGYQTNLLDGFFAQIASNSDNSRNVFYNANGTLRNAPLDAGLVFHFVATADLVQFDPARDVNGTMVPIMEMVDAEDNAISVSHLIRNRNGLRALYENADGTKTTPRQALKNLVNKIIETGAKGLTIKVTSVQRYPSNHPSRADQIRMMTFEQLNG